jgi:hypothetical protein
VPKNELSASVIGFSIDISFGTVFCTFGTDFCGDAGAGGAFKGEK